MASNIKSKNKRKFEVEVDGEILHLEVKKPDYQTSRKAQLVWNRSFKDAVDSGALVRKGMGRLSEDQHLWDESKDEEVEALRKKILENERKIRAGGISLKQAKELAIQVRRDRFNFRQLNMERNSLDGVTAEAQAENEKFFFLISECTVYSDSGKKYFKDVHEFLENEDDPVASKAAVEFGKLYYGYDDRFELRLPENKFLMDYGFADKEGWLINAQGHRVDADGKRINENGDWINDDGEIIDEDGNVLTPEGELKVEFTPFVDDEGNPVQPADDQVEVEAKSKADAVDQETEVAELASV